MSIFIASSKEFSHDLFSRVRFCIFKKINFRILYIALRLQTLSRALKEAKLKKQLV